MNLIPNTKNREPNGLAVFYFKISELTYLITLQVWVVPSL